MYSHVATSRYDDDDIDYEPVSQSFSGGADLSSAALDEYFPHRAVDNGDEGAGPGGGGGGDGRGGAADAVAEEEDYEPVSQSFSTGDLSIAALDEYFPQPPPEPKAPRTPISPTSLTLSSSSSSSSSAAAAAAALEAEAAAALPPALRRYVRLVTSVKVGRVARYPFKSVIPRQIELAGSFSMPCPFKSVLQVAAWRTEPEAVLALQEALGCGTFGVVHRATLKVPLAALVGEGPTATSSSSFSLSSSSSTSSSAALVPPPAFCSSFGRAHPSGAAAASGACSLGLSAASVLAWLANAAASKPSSSGANGGDTGDTGGGGGSEGGGLGGVGVSLVGSTQATAASGKLDGKFRDGDAEPVAVKVTKTLTVEHSLLYDTPEVTHASSPRSVLFVGQMLVQAFACGLACARDTHTHTHRPFSFACAIAMLCR